MVFLLLSILSSTAIFIAFKLIGRYKVNTFSAIIVNYIIACSAGFFLSHSSPFNTKTLHSDWLPLSLFLGVLFITMFRLIGQSVLKVGVSTTSVATKMSVIIPILFTVAIEANDTLTPIKIFGIFLALVAVFLTSYKPERGKIQLSTTMLPILIFLGVGILDSLVKYAQFKYVSNELNPIFSGVTFGVAGIMGILLLPLNRNAAKDLTKIKTWMLGIALGLANFGSMYFFIKALNHINLLTGKQVQGSVVFGINNIGIVALGVIIGYLLFKERPTKLNWLGIALSLLAIVILTFSQG
ncbi:MAG: DMT family transporter [Bacteroidales bacterium]|nr:MAG: DMT family transporter [Bacteroidales bacterium]